MLENTTSAAAGGRQHRTVLVTGATGYIGGRLTPTLLELGHRVRVLVRNPAKLQDVEWRERVETAVGDAELANPE